MAMLDGDEPRSDLERLDWLHDHLKLTIAYALNWPYVPQDKFSFRTALDRHAANTVNRLVMDGQR